MAYAYTQMRPDLFTERGVEMLDKVRANVQRLLRQAGAFRAQEAWEGIGGDGWLKLAALDYMLEKGEIREVVAGRSTGSCSARWRSAPHRGPGQGPRAAALIGSDWLVSVVAREGADLEATRSALLQALESAGIISCSDEAAA